MQLYAHIIDLRISHPSLDPDVVTRTLGIEPQRAWRAGEPRKTSKGTKLDGVYPTGYWSSNPFSYGWTESTDNVIEDVLDEVIKVLEPHSEFLNKISKEGQVRVWISSQSNRNYTIELSSHALARLAAMGVTVVHDVFQ